MTIRFDPRGPYEVEERDVLFARPAGLELQARVYRPKGELKKLRETKDPITLLREKLELSDEEVDEVDREVQEIVEASVEFAKNGTDPKPEDALKNVYA